MNWLWYKLLHDQQNYKTLDWKKANSLFKSIFIFFFLLAHECKLHKSIKMFCTLDYEYKHGSDCFFVMKFCRARTGKGWGYE